MSVKDKIIFGILVILIAVAGYFQYMASNMISRMDELNENDSKHVDVVHNEFREDLRKLTLKFIGRGKHLQKAQQDIVANTEFIEYVTDSLGNAIQLVQYNLDELDRTVSKKFDNVEADIQDLTVLFIPGRNDARMRHAFCPKRRSMLDGCICSFSNCVLETICWFCNSFLIFWDGSTDLWAVCSFEHIFFPYKMVGLARFELTTSRPPDERATRLRYSP